jgi:methyl-accepting chemotaxis protein
MIPIVVCTAGALYIANIQLKTTATAVANHILEQRLSVEMKTFLDEVERDYGRMELQGVMLVDEKGKPLAKRYEVVDRVSKRFSSTATIFSRDGNDFTRIVTTVKKEDGTRADGTKLGADSKAYQSLINGRSYTGEADILGKSYLTIYEPLLDSRGAVIGILYAGIPKNEVFIIIDKIFGNSMLWISLAMLALIVCITAVIGLVVSRSLRPMKEVVRGLEELGRGHLSNRLNMSRNDEIGGLSRAMDKFADNLQQNVIFNIQQISEGNTDIAPAITDDKDEIGPALNKMIKAIGSMSDEVRRCCNAALNGNLTNRADATPYQGKYQKIIRGFNDTMDALMDPINEASGVLEKIACKDMTARMIGEYRGDHAKIKRVINSVVENLDKALQQVAIGAEQVASASIQVSMGGQSLSQGASEQASSLEEVSSSLQEMSSMTKQNTLNAREAKGVADQARGSADKGVESMNRMSSAINQIKSSSAATAKIVRTIDEIAFQTNLLALNAAVEAARAGDAGKGFAVVAEEVRNLAMRSAEAAKNTANLIEEAVKNSENGVAINAEVLTNFQEITEKTNKVSHVVAEIAAASEQQDQGIGQLNKAVEHLNQLTQQNAANAEESASAAEEMSSQSEEMRSMVAGFKLTDSGNFNHSSRAGQSGHLPYNPGIQRKGARAISGIQPDPRKVIPLDDRDHSILSNF